MADLLFGLPFVRQRRTRIYQYSDSILIYSNQKLRSRYRFGRASIEYNTNLIKAGLQRKTNCYYFLKPIDEVLIALQVYANGGLLQVVGDTTGVDKSTVSLAVHNADTILETITVRTHGKMHYGILIVDYRNNLCGLLTKCEVKMAGYWPSSFFACLWTETKLPKKERGQYPAILTEQTWSKKDLLYGVWCILLAGYSG